MYHLRITTWINAPIARCFDLARSVEAHLESESKTGERVVAGPASGLLGLGDEVTWEAAHFGITKRLTPAGHKRMADRPLLQPPPGTGPGLSADPNDPAIQPDPAGGVMSSAARTAYGLLLISDCGI